MNSTSFNFRYISLRNSYKPWECLLQNGQFTHASSDYK